MIPLLDAAAAAAGDEAAVTAGGTWAGLMERAAGHLARGVVGARGYGYGLRVALLVGKGNNGGDGWAAARRLRSAGASAWVVAVAGLDAEMSAEASTNRERWLASGGRVSDGLDDLEAALAWCDVAVDALLGTGISGAPRGAVGDAAQALVRAHDTGTTVVACDVPSGVSSDDGSAPPGSVRADLTVTFGGMKRGLLLHPGAASAGTVVIGDLGPGYEPPDTGWQALTAASAAPRPYGADTDKRARGVVLAVGGSLQRSGAAALTGMGALAAGAGLVTVATPAPAQPIVAAHHPALMTLPLAHDHGEIAADAVGALDGLLGDAEVVAAGPGLGHHAAAGEVVAHLRGAAPRLVLDADGLNVHRDAPDTLADHTGALVLTPHVRELQRIGGGDDAEQAWAERVERVPELARRYDATIVCKGPGSLVAAPDGRVWVTPTGGPALGSGGTGDVLAGVIAAAIAAADDVPLAVAQAVWWHGLAGEVAGAPVAGRASAAQVLDAVGQALRRTADLAATDPRYPFGAGPA